MILGLDIQYILFLWSITFESASS